VKEGESSDNLKRGEKFEDLLCAALGPESHQQGPSSWAMYWKTANLYRIYRH